MQKIFRRWVLIPILRPQRQNCSVGISKDTTFQRRLQDSLSIRKPMPNSLPCVGASPSLHELVPLPSAADPFQLEIPIVTSGPRSLPLQDNEQESAHPRDQIQREVQEISDDGLRREFDEWPLHHFERTPQSAFTKHTMDASIARSDRVDPRLDIQDEQRSDLLLPSLSMLSPIFCIRPVCTTRPSDTSPSSPFSTSTPSKTSTRVS